MHCDLDTSIPEWIIDHPETAVIFEQLGLDASCGGKSLKYVATRKGLNPQVVLSKLKQQIRRRHQE